MASADWSGLRALSAAHAAAAPTQVFPTLDKVIDGARPAVGAGASLPPLHLLLAPSPSLAAAAFNAGAAWAHGLPSSISLAAQYSTPRTFLAALAKEQQQQQQQQQQPLAQGVAAAAPASRSLRSRPAAPAPVPSATAAAGPGFPSRPSWDMLPHGFGEPRSGGASSLLLS